MLVLTAMASESPKIWLAVRGTSATPRSQACDEVMSFSRKRRKSERGWRRCQMDHFVNVQVAGIVYNYIMTQQDKGCQNQLCVLSRAWEWNMVQVARTSKSRTVVLCMT